MSAAPTSTPAPASSPPALASTSNLAASSSTGSFQLTPLYGCEAGGSALCSILRLDDCTLLLDLGWDERYHEEMIAGLRGIIPDVDAVLITHPDMAHLGALPYAVGKLGLTAPIYCTLPVWRMGQMFLYSAHQALAAYDTPPFTLDDLDKSMDQMRQLKYSETVKLKERGEGIEITPSCAGHMLGGAFWHIKKETESIIYAVDFNHAAERHLNGALLNAPQLHRPSALITDATNALVTGDKRSVQDAKLASAISDRLRMGGNVLLPVDAAGRVLELLMVIHGTWVQQQLNTTYTLAFLDSQAGNTVDFARSQLEWMTDKCRKLFDTSKTNPFQFPNLQILTTKAQVDSLHRPFCLLATNYNLETSLAQDVFCDLSTDWKNLLLFTSRAPEWSLGGQFFDHTQPNSLKRLMPREVTFMRRRRVRLEGEELQAYLEEQTRVKQQAKLEHDKDVDDDADEDEDMGTGANIVSGKFTTIDGIRRQTKKVQIYPLFPFAEPKRSFDIWGEQLTQEELRVITGATAGASSLSQNGPGSGGANYLNNARMRAGNKLELQQPAPTSHYGDNMMDDVPSDQLTHESALKTVKESVTIPLNCAVQYIDLEGRSFSNNIKTVIKDLQPRKLIILTGAQPAKDHLKQHCVESGICTDVVIPKANQTISVTSESNLYRVNLKDNLFHQLQFVQVSDEYEVAYVDGQVKLNYQQTNLPILAPPTVDRSKGHPAVFLGQVRPAELQQIVLNEGIPCELVGGSLVCLDGAVIVQKVNDFQISIQGALCDEYYRIRDLLYQQYQIV